MKRLFQILSACCILITATGFTAEEFTFEQLGSLEPLAGNDTPIQPGDRPVLLQFWASWCHSCAGIMWDMDELLTANPDIDYIAVSLDKSSDDAAAYIAKHALYEKYRNQYFHDREKSLSALLDVETVPTILLIDRNGSVRVQKSGHLNSKDKQDLARGMKEST